MSIKVRKVGPDWMFECAEHDEAVWTFDHPSALIAAYGHHVWAHRLRPLWTVGITDGHHYAEVDLLGISGDRIDQGEA